MNKPLLAQPSRDVRIADVKVPRSLVRSATGFGGIIEGAYLRGDLICKNGTSPRLLPASQSPAPKLLLPRFTEAHVHLDKCHSVDRMPAVGGNLRAAIDAQSQDKAFWSEEDLRARATRGLQELVAAGCKAARSHVDWSHGEDARTPPLAWHILKELAQDFRDHITLNLAPLTSLEDLADPQTAKTLGQEISCVGGALGSFVLDQPNLPKGIQTAFEIAMHHGIALDFHVDEGLAERLDGLELIAQTAIEVGFEGPILCGHACSMMNLSGDALERRINLVAQSGLTIVTLPSTNLYLQGRTEGTPDRRGLTRVRELRAAGVPVIVGTDNVRDAFCPLGRHNPRASLALAVLAAHLDPPLADLWPMITTDAARALGMAQTFVDEASIDDLLVCGAPTTTSALDDSTQLYPLKTYADRTVS